MNDQENNNDIIVNQITLIMGAIDEDESYTVLNETDFLIKILPKELQEEKKIVKLKRRLDNFLLNKQNSRLLRLLQKLKTEPDVAVEYFAQDYGTDERLLFQEELEADMLTTYAEIRDVLAWIVREKLGGDIEI
jgi:hypothetical protein